MIDKKTTLLFVSPLMSRSGYGDHAREIASIIYEKYNKLDIKFAITPWGNNPQTGLNSSLQKKYSNLFVSETDQYEGCDLYVQLGLPSEFKCVGKKTNIGITAGVEVDIVSKQMLVGANAMDLVIVPSTFTKETFENSFKEHELEKTTEFLVIPEYSSKHFYLNETCEGVGELDSIKEDFCFLSIGQWTAHGDVDDGGRKNVNSLITTFCKTFANTDNKPGLILKTSGSNFSISDYFTIEDKINNLTVNYTNPPSIYLIHGDLTEGQMFSIYAHKKSKAFITHTRGEGFGRPILEATLVGLPVIATKWSGHLDFIDKKHSTLLPGKLTRVSTETQLFSKNSKWMSVDEEISSQKMKDLYTNYDKHLPKALKLKEKNINKFNYDTISKLYTDILDKYI